MKETEKNMGTITKGGKKAEDRMINIPFAAIHRTQIILIKYT